MTQLYKLTAPSGKSYIGVTKKPLPYRVNEHSHAKTVMGRAVRKYGADIVAKVLAVGEEGYIYDLEKRAIEAFNTMSPHGYNLREGGQGGRHTKESRRKIGDANRGQTRSLEARKRIGAASLGRMPSQDARKRMSAAQKKRHAEGRGFKLDTKGKPLSEEHKQKIAQGQKRRWARRQ